MKRLTIGIFSLVAFSSSVLADSKPSESEAAKLKEVLAVWGCEGGVLEKESEGSGLFEVDDTKCKDGNQYDAKFDKEFSLQSLTRD